MPQSRHEQAKMQGAAGLAARHTSPVGEAQASTRHGRLAAHRLWSILQGASPLTNRPPCISALSLPQSAAISTQDTITASGWCAWKTSMCRAAYRVRRAASCVRSKPSVCTGTGKSSARAGAVPPTKKRCMNCRPPKRFIPAAARVKRSPTRHCTASTARSIRAPAATAFRPDAKDGRGGCAPKRTSRI